MKKTVFVLLAAIAAPIMVTTAATAAAPAWEIDPAHSTIQFSVRHLFTQVTGTFDRVEGEVRFSPDDLEGSRIDVRIPVASVNTRNAQRDAHLKTADWFDEPTHAAMRFVSTRIRRVEGNRYVADGRLTIRGTTRDLSLPFEFLGSMAHPMKPGHIVAGARAETTLKRTDFGVGTGSWAETAMVGDEVSVVISIEATRPAEAASAPAPPAPASRPATRPARRY